MKNNDDIKNNILEITKEWIGMTHKVLDLKRIPSVEIRDILKNTYEVLNYYHKDEAVPKTVCKMLLEMDDFLYFASMITDKEFNDDPYLYQAIFSIVESLKIGFFKGEYECEYPILKMNNADKSTVVFDLQNGHIEDLL